MVAGSFRNIEETLTVFVTYRQQDYPFWASIPNYASSRVPEIHFPSISDQLKFLEPFPLSAKDRLLRDWVPSRAAAGIQSVDWGFSSVRGELFSGPECKCGRNTWRVGDGEVECKSCGRLRRARVRGFIVNGPKCLCNNRDWFVGEEIARCSWCAESRDACVRAFITVGPECCCWGRDWLIGKSGARCTRCAQWREANVQGYLLHGPPCSCNSTHWLVGESGYRCTWCASWREK